MDTEQDILLRGMPVNSKYINAEGQIFDKYNFTPAARALSIGRQGLRVRVVEGGSGDPVLFLHGYGLCTAHWAPLVSRLLGVRSLMLDAPGHGASDAVDFTGVDLRAWYKEMLIGCLDILGLEQVHLIGHSQGAMQALWLALDAPTRVRSVVSIGTPAVAFGARVESLRILANPNLWRVFLSIPVPAPVYRNILAGNMGQKAVLLHPELVRATYQSIHRPGFGKTVSSYLREMFRGAEGSPPRYVLSDAELRCMTRPVLVLWGEEDVHFQPLEEGKARAGQIPHSRFELVRGGHEPWLDDPEAVANLISAFLREH